MRRPVAVFATSLVVLAVTCKSDGGGAPSVPTTITVSPNAVNFSALGQTQPLTASVFDQNGSPMSSAVTWSTDNGSVAGVTTAGVVSATGNGSTTVRAAAGSVQGSATVNVAQVATILVKAAGDAQTGQPGTALAAGLVVRANDANGNGVANVAVALSVTQGDGSLSATSVNTQASGQTPAVTWTLGGSLGAQQVTATATGLAPVVFSATASILSLTGVTPDTLVEGQAATLTGNGFDATPGNNTVMVGGVAAAVTAASPTSLTVTVPAFGCRPARDVNVTVTVGGGTSNVVSRRLHPPSFADLAVGEQLIVEDPAQFCLQFRPSASGGDGYLVGVGAAAEIPTSLLSFSLTTVTGGAAAVTASAASRSAPGLPVAAWRPNLDLLTQKFAQIRAERRLREWEARNLPRLAAAEGANLALRQAAPAMPPPAVGDTIRFRIANIASSSNACDTVRSILTTVRRVGTAGVWVTDNNNPTTDSLTLAEIQAYSDTFDTKIYAVDTLYFGTPSDIDNNQRVVIVLSIEVNEFPIGAAGYVFGGDLFGRNICRASNLGEVFYGQVPDPINAAGTGERSKADVLFQMPSLIAHEFAHNIQMSRRVVLASGQFMASWEMEGQASLAEEVVGHSILGNTIGQNYGAATAFGTNAGDRWYATNFGLLALYYGWNGTGTTAGDTVPNAPATCTLYGNTTLVTTCSPFAFYGASWAFQRYLSDRFGPSYAGGEAGLHRDWIGKNVNLRGVPNVEALVSRSVDSLLSQWAGMLYADDRVPAVGAPLTMTSWNLLNIFSAVIPSARLRPTDRSWSAFSDSRSVRGGSNAYTRLLSSGAHPALAIRVRDPVDATLGTTMRPQLWVVRIQ